MRLDPAIFSLLAPPPRAVKEAFSPSPAVGQAALQGAQMGGMPMDPAMMGGAPGGMPPGGAPPGADPAAMMGGTPPGAPPAPQDPAAAAAGPPQDPVVAKLDQLIQLMQGGGQGGAAGAAGKPGGVSVKIDPSHFHAVTHKISVMETIMKQMAEAMGLHVPAEQLFDLQPPVTPPGAAPGAPGQPAGAQPQPAQPQAPQASQIATQLPSLPPVAGKAASVRLLVDEAGVPVEPAQTPKAFSPARAFMRGYFNKQKAS